MKKLNARLSKSFKTFVNQNGLYKKTKPFRILFNYPEFILRRKFSVQHASQDLYPCEFLKREGYMSFEPPADLTAELTDFVRKRQEEQSDVAPRKGKVFLSDLVDVDDFKPDSILFRFALNEKILNTIAQYLGGAPFLESIDIVYSRPDNAETLKQSQLWHSDSTDSKIIKVFVFIEDVTAENGPFTLLPIDESKKVPARLLLNPSYLTDEEVAPYVDLNKRVEITGPAGTAVMVDAVNCLHFGSRCQKPRVAFMAYYSTGFSYRKRHFPKYRVKWKNVKGFEHLPLSKMQQLALGFAPTSRYQKVSL